MNQHLLCFSNHKFKTANNWLLQSAKKFRIEKIHHFTQEAFLKTEFAITHTEICSEPFGAGFYIWKPYYILETLQQLDEGDVLMYIDSGQLLISDPIPLVEIAKANGIVLFSNEQGYLYFNNTKLSFNEHNCYREINKLKYWCKGDCFYLMKALDPHFLEAPMADASMMLFRKDERSLQFVNQWLAACCNRRCISWDKTEGPVTDQPEFIFHVYDQSILSVLAAQWHLSLYRCPSQYGNHYKQPEHRVPNEHLVLPYAACPYISNDYGTITWHHRYKRKPIFNRIKDYMYRELMLANASLFKFRWQCLNRRLKTPVEKIF